MITKSDFSYSLKNIPIPSNTEYLKGVITATEKFLQNLRWKVIHLLKDDSKPKKEQINYYGFKTPHNAKSVPLLESFEADMTHLVSNLEFHNNDKATPFQSKLSSDIKKINKSKNLFIKADKSSNVYEVDVETYKKLITENITANYKKANENIQTEINENAKSITEKLKISDRVEIPPIKDCFVTLKDHKPEFPAIVKCRLINPAKSNIGRISKEILDNINLKIKFQLQLQQLKNTDEALKWFKNIENKNKSLMLICDIVDFYPSISKKLVNDAITFAERHTEITDIEKSVLLNARESLLHHDGEIWTKKNGTFDVTMGAYDGAQISDLVGLLILSKIKHEIPELNFALYRDDGIASHLKVRPQVIDKMRKKLHKIFKELGLTITVQTTLTKADFLDVTLNILENTYQPYRKPNNIPLYINRYSNHPPHVIKNVPISVNKRLTTISSSESLFNSHILEYQDALKKSGFAHTLKYKHPCLSGTQRSETDDQATKTPTRATTRLTASQPNPSAQRPSPPPAIPPDNHRPHIPQTKPIKSAHAASASAGPRTTASSTQPPSSAPPTHIHPSSVQSAPQHRAATRRSQRIRDRNQSDHTSHTTPPASNQPLDNSPPATPPSQTPTTSHTAGSKSKKRRNRKRNIVFWNVPYNRNLSTNIGKQFLALVNKHFPANSELASALNRHTIKIAYSTTKNMDQIISAHNARILKAGKEAPTALPCNCRKECPLQGRSDCRSKPVIYKAEIGGSIYIGQTMTEFRTRCARHRTSFRKEYKKSDTALASFIWDKGLNKDTDGEICEPKVRWSILRHCTLYKPGQRNCDLCLSEKASIITHLKSPKCINKKTDLSSKCNHRKQWFYCGLHGKATSDYEAEDPIT